jgi:pimeloyl-ACP methyl ester carboxylesterase
LTCACTDWPEKWPEIRPARRVSSGASSERKSRCWSSTAEDRILPIGATAQRLPDLVHDARLVVVEGDPHNIAWTHPEEVNSALLKFLAE